ncbi:DoxX family protein [Pedobacter polaris]|uniref:DoxX family protein n=1 Tax=Pedobacter polaris TaxID=2571273 RepID=A0A4U1CKF1_9SPHI|nr:DoxX family protein [Pedobacter polaris]TKC08130.1 DoxX family protein [Pedobacter polaris]
MNLWQKIALWLMIIFYFGAGVNHFIKPSPYLTIIPPYLPYPKMLNYIAGFFEITFALLLFSVKARKYACWGIILMLIVFLSSHIIMIQKANDAPFLLGNWTITPFIAWLRIPFQVIFVFWAYWCSRMKFNLI